MLVKTKDLSVGYPKNPAILQQVTMEIAAGKMYALLGPNGSGKSTFIRTISGLVNPLAGEILIEKSVKLSMVPQFKKIHMEYPITVEKVLKLPQESKGLFFRKVKFSPQEEELLQEIGIQPILKQLLGECSGGQLQKVLIARSLLCQPDLIFLDEPMDALDAASRETILKLLQKNMQERKTSLFIITHNLAKDWLANFNHIFQIQDDTIIA